MNDLERRLTEIRPSKRQIQWQQLEFYGFIHYGLNQFTGREWGTGQETPQIFQPKQLDTDQWCDSMAKAGMKGVIITAKHHDGFCLWDTKLTDHSVMHSPYGKDIVAQLARSCKRFDLKLGIYLSPWDRHDVRYGQGEAYDDYFCQQLEELLTRYGEVFCVWFDDACGEGSNGKRQQYDWDRYYALIRRLQPDTVISVCGPDVRWCGNEAGHCRKSEWSVVPAIMADNERIKEASQQKDDHAFRQRFPSDEEDLGSRAALDQVSDLIWYPAEVNTSIRPGWFYHPEEDDKVRPLEELVSIYLQSVGGNAAFLLNIPPHPQGYFAEPDVKRLRELGEWIKRQFACNLLETAALSASTAEEGHGVDAINCTNGYWKSIGTDPTPAIEMDVGTPITPQYLMLQEEISEGQRIEAFSLQYLDGTQWRTACSGTVVGYKRICPINPKHAGSIIAQRWRLQIQSCRGCATLKKLALFS